MDKVELANRRAKDAIIELLVTLKMPKTDERRRTLTLRYEEMKWPDLLKAKDRELVDNPYRNSVLVFHMKEHMEWCIRETERVKSAGKQREAVYA